MRPLYAIFCVLLLIFTKLSTAQTGFKLLPGWIADKVLETDNHFIVVGKGTENLPNFHNLQITYIDKSTYKILKEQTYFLDDNDVSSFRNGSAVKTDTNGNILVGGFTVVNDSFISALYSISESSFKAEFQRFGARSYILDLVKNENGWNWFGVHIEDIKSTPFVNSYFYNSSLDSFTHFNCNELNLKGGCELLVRNVISTNDGFLIGCVARSYFDNEIEEGLVIKTNKFGVEEWRLPLINDTSTHTNMMIGELTNGNYLAAWNDYYIKPNTAAHSGPYPRHNSTSTMWFAEFTTNGEVIREWNIRDQLSKYYNLKTIQTAFHDDIIKTSDGGFAIVGYTYDYDSVQHDMGYLVKLGGEGNLEWFRKYIINISKPIKQGGSEDFYLNGVKELQSGGYILAGDYLTDPSDSFPFGDRIAAVLVVDEKGCLKPNCVGLGIETIDLEIDYFHIYPNPTKNTLHIKANFSSINNQDYQVTITDLFGRTIQEHPQMEQQLDVSHLNSGIYYLTIFNQSEGIRETHKIVVE